MTGSRCIFAALVLSTALALGDPTLRRTTLIVDDLDASVAFYEAIGFQVWYDNRRSEQDPRGILGGEELPLGTPPPKQSALKILRGPHPDQGMIGLLEYRDPPPPDRRSPRGRLGRGDAILMVSLDDIAAAEKRLSQRNASFHSPPTNYVVYGPDGEIASSGTRMFVYDPDGRLVEVVQRD